MFRRLIVCGAFVWLSMSGPLLAKPNFGTSEIEQPVPEAVSRLALPSANVRPKSAPPSTEMLEMIANWITSRFGLPQSNALPRVALMSPTDIAALRSGDLALEGLHSITIINANLANLERAVVSVYEKAKKNDLPS